PIHPDAKGTNLYMPPKSLPVHDLVGSHALGSDFAGDVVGNAAALDVHKFLKLSHDGQSLMELVLSRDPDLAAALSDDPDQAETWMTAFAGIILARGKTASHGFAKQLYWLVGDDPTDDAGYHLLAPLYASSLAHRVFALINEDRFSESAKAARKARRDGEFSERPVHEYTQLAVQKLGGTKPQNISQLNSERGGSNYLLASLPPSWQSRDVQPLLNTDSMFHRFERRRNVKAIVKELLQFLKANPASNFPTREHVKAMVAALLDELLEFGAEHRTLPPSWSQHPDCDLGIAEKHWLDPHGVAAAVQAGEMSQPNDSAGVLSEAFARWFNHQLRDPLPMGDPEHQQWRNLALVEFEAEDWEVDHVE
ncbi:MAG: type I-F CRISPR-associated protein Csy1, partial [Lysobacter sp.]|nr:type I-F CRISPR-associated protein Csy1 [Lysobacter sp.]